MCTLAVLDMVWLVSSFNSWVGFPCQEVQAQQSRSPSTSTSCIHCSAQQQRAILWGPEIGGAVTLETHRGPRSLEKAAPSVSCLLPTPFPPTTQLTASNVHAYYTADHEIAVIQEYHAKHKSRKLRIGLEVGLKLGSTWRIGVGEKDIGSASFKGRQR